MFIFSAQTNKRQDANSLSRKLRQSAAVPEGEEGASGEHGVT